MSDNKNVMESHYKTLKERHRRERDNYPETLSLRVHRALSWLQRAEMCEDDDGRFIFLWIAFNAAYANDMGQYRTTETALFRNFIDRLVTLDRDNELYELVWEQFPGAIRLLLDNHYVYQPYWDHLSGIPGNEGWESQFNASKRKAFKALAAKDTTTVLAVVLSRLYTLRNQLIHGGATWNSGVNRTQLGDGTAVLATLVPLVIKIMMDSANAIWGEACYPVVSGD